MNINKLIGKQIVFKGIYQANDRLCYRKSTCKLIGADPDLRFLYFFGDFSLFDRVPLDFYTRDNPNIIHNESDPFNVPVIQVCIGDILFLDIKNDNDGLLRELRDAQISTINDFIKSLSVGDESDRNKMVKLVLLKMEIMKNYKLVMGI